MRRACFPSPHCGFEARVAIVAHVFSTTHIPVFKVDDARVFVKDHVFQHGAKTDGLPDLRLVALLEPDTLGVAAALNVEDARGAPAVLVIPNEGPVGVS